MTDAVIAGLDILCNQGETNCKTDVININKLNRSLKRKQQEYKIYKTTMIL